MSADLERAYAKLAEKADKAIIPSFSGVLARARRRRRRQVSTSLAAVAALAILAGAATLFTRGTTLEPGSKIFVTFDGSSGQVLAFPSPTRSIRTISDQQRSYVMWEGLDDQVWIAVIDLATGRTPWEPVSLGKLGGVHPFEVSQEAILLFTEPQSRNGLESIIAVDPLTGKVMWTLPYRFSNFVLYSDTLVVSSNPAGRPEALDLRTGRPKWTAPDPLTNGRLFAMRDYRAFESYSGGPWPVPTDQRVVLRFADGRLQIRDAGTGEVLSQRSGMQAPPGLMHEIVIGDNLYWLDPQGILRASLTGSDAPQRLYPQTDIDRTTMLQPCGPTLICLDSLNELAAIDGQGHQVWRIPHWQGSRTLVGGSRIVSQEGPTRSVVYDQQGKQLLPPGYQDGTAAWTDPDNLLIFRPAGVTGYSMTTGEGKVLGQILWQNGCSWNATKLVCPTPTGVSVWTYALS